MIPCLSASSRSYKLTGTIKAHGAPVSGVAFHPTKPLFVSVSDACWRMWSVQSASTAELIMNGEGHRAWLADADFPHFPARAGGNGVEWPPPPLHFPLLFLIRPRRGPPSSHTMLQHLLPRSRSLGVLAALRAAAAAGVPTPPTRGMGKTASSSTPSPPPPLPPKNPRELAAWNHKEFENSSSSEEIVAAERGVRGGDEMGGDFLLEPMPPGDVGGKKAGGSDPSSRQLRTPTRGKGGEEGSTAAGGGGQAATRGGSN